MEPPNVLTTCPGEESHDRLADPPASRFPEDHSSDQSALLSAILQDCRDPASFLELYYWSREEELLKLVRTLAQLPQSTRRALEFFLSHVSENLSFSIVQHGAGRTIKLNLQTTEDTDARDECASIS